MSNNSIFSSHESFMSNESSNSGSDKKKKKKEKEKKKKKKKKDKKKKDKWNIEFNVVQQVINT